MARPEYAVNLGLDVGKDEHHATGLNPAGEGVHDKALPQDETARRALYDDLAKRGPVLTWSISRPRSARCQWRSLAMLAWMSLTCPGWQCVGSPTCTPAPPRPTLVTPTPSPRQHGRRRTRCAGSTSATRPLADLEVIVGYDDLAKEVTRITNRIRGLLTQIHPALERALGPDPHHRAVLELRVQFGGPTGMRKAQRRQLIAATKRRAPRKHAAIVE